VIRWLEARLVGQAGASVLQPWRDLRRLLCKETIVAESASRVTAFAPLASAAATLVAAVLVPSFALGMSLAGFADLLVIAGLLALARASLALAGMDAGTAFGGMAASRTMALACLAEPAVLLAIFVLALLAGSSNLDLVAAMQQEGSADWHSEVGLAFAATLLVAFLATGWAPTRQAELAMRRGALALESSGRDLALFEAADAVRLLLWFNLIGAMFLPFGMAPSGAGPLAWLLGLASWMARTLLFAAALAVAPMMLGRIRMARAAQMLGVAIILGLLAAALLFADVATA
jgi:formate hydrogenlyase subunit 4